MSSKKNRKRQKEGAEGTSPSLSAAASRSGTPAPLARPAVAAPGMLVVTNFLEKGEARAGSAEAGAPEGGAASGGGRDTAAPGPRRAGGSDPCRRLRGFPLLFILSSHSLAVLGIESLGQARRPPELWPHWRWPWLFEDLLFSGAQQA